MSFDYQQQQTQVQDDLWKRKREAKKRARRGREETPEPLAITSLMDAMVIILCFLLKSYASDPVNIQQSDVLELPMSVSKEPLERAVVIAITADAILVDDVKRSAEVGLVEGRQLVRRKIQLAGVVSAAFSVERRNLASLQRGGEGLFVHEGRIERD